MTAALSYIISIFIGGLLGGLIGLERAFRAKEAGIRTHFLVGLGSALFMVISMHAFGDSGFDAARVAAQVVTGIGFIGAGVIIYHKNAVRGITTAAGLWVAAAIGLACGAEMYKEAAAATVLVLIVLELMHVILPNHGDNLLVLTLSSPDRETLSDAVRRLQKVDGYKVDGCRISYKEERYFASVELRVRRKSRMEGVLQLFSLVDGVQVEEIE